MSDQSEATFFLSSIESSAPARDRAGRECVVIRATEHQTRRPIRLVLPLDEFRKAAAAVIRQKGGHSPGTIEDLFQYLRSRD